MFSQMKKQAGPVNRPVMSVASVFEKDIEEEAEKDSLGIFSKNLVYRIKMMTIFHLNMSS